jgi:hypothetical protein
MITVSGDVEDISNVGIAHGYLPTTRRNQGPDVGIFWKLRPSVVCLPMAKWKQERVCAKTALTLKGRCNSCITGEDESDETSELQKKRGYQTQKHTVCLDYQQHRSWRLYRACDQA